VFFGRFVAVLRALSAVLLRRTEARLTREADLALADGQARAGC